MTALARSARRVLWVACAVVAVVFLPAPRARASAAVAFSLEELAAASHRIDVVAPVDHESRWEGGRIFTYWRVRVTAHIAGDGGEDELFVRTAGGIVDKIGQRVEGEPAFVADEEALVFLRRIQGAPNVFIVTGRAQGEYAVANNRSMLRRSPDLGLVIPRAARPPRADLPPAVSVLHEATVAEARRVIVAAWEGTHGR
jgi:hypothetical protein